MRRWPLACLVCAPAILAAPPSPTHPSKLRRPRAFGTLVQHNVSARYANSERYVEDFQGLPLLHRFHQRRLPSRDETPVLEVRQTRSGLFSTDRLKDGFEKRSFIREETMLLERVEIVDSITRNDDASALPTPFAALHRINRAVLGEKLLLRR
jgi:hypothetical protein